MKKIIILGAGISGLSLGWFLKQKYGSDIHLQILESTSRTGGWIQTHYAQDSLFDQGPRSCRTRGHGIETLKLIEALGLSQEVLPADASAKYRYLYTDKSLNPLPSGLFSLLTSPYTPALLRGAWKDLRTPPSEFEDETIHSFITRRFNAHIAESLVDPLTLGIYAGDIRQLSVRSCFPEWFEREQRCGGLLKSLWRAKTAPPCQQDSAFVQSMRKHSIFTLRQGMESLVQALSHRLQAHITYQAKAVSIKYDRSRWHIQLHNGECLQADKICAAVPAQELGRLLRAEYPALAAFPLSIPHVSVAMVNAGFVSKVLPYEGFGYLIPSKEQEIVLGTVWDSSAFSAQNGALKTRLTIMLGGAHHPEIETLSEHTLVDIALQALKKHMRITASPDVIRVRTALASIPQYLLGHHHKKELFLSEIATALPQLSVLGMAFHGVAVNDGIAQAKRLSEKFTLDA